MLCTSASVECGVSARPRRLDRRHVARGTWHVAVALSGWPVGTWCCVWCSSVCLDRDVTCKCTSLYLFEQEFQRPTGVRVEDLLKKALFPLLKAAKKAAGRVKKDSEMSEVVFDRV